LTEELEKAPLLEVGKSSRYGLQCEPKVVRNIPAIHWEGYDTRWCQATIHFEKKRRHAFW
jgi:hypothetical protein